jgi:HSP20 family molecular chaperone IbpA
MKNNLINRKNDNIFSLFDDFFNRSLFKHEIFDMKRNFIGNYSIEKIDQHNYFININVAGFNKEDIDIEFEGDYLHIKGKKESFKDDKYVYNGFSSQFENSFMIEKDSEVIDAKIDNGILKIKVKENPKHLVNKRKILIK